MLLVIACFFAGVFGLQFASMADRFVDRPILYQLFSLAFVLVEFIFWLLGGEVALQLIGWSMGTFLFGTVVGVVIWKWRKTK